jgi:hypothetical protein
VKIKQLMTNQDPSKVAIHFIKRNAYFVGTFHEDLDPYTQTNTKRMLEMMIRNLESMDDLA